jgi:hypothetical protein
MTSFFGTAIQAGRYFIEVDPVTLYKAELETSTSGAASNMMNWVYYCLIGLCCELSVARNGNIIPYKSK